MTVAGAPLISCIMATRGEIVPARFAIDCYRAQTHPQRELLIVCADPDPPLRSLIGEFADPSIRLLPPSPTPRVGGMRNAAIAAARGDWLAVWDDDDLSHPERLRWQLAAAAETKTEACVLQRLLLWWPGTDHLAMGCHRIWENTLLIRRDAAPSYPLSAIGSDTTMLKNMVIGGLRLARLDCPEAYVYVAHGRNLRGAAHFEMLRATGEEIGLAARTEVFRALDALVPLSAYRAAVRDVG